MTSSASSTRRSFTSASSTNDLRVDVVSTAALDVSGGGGGGDQASTSGDSAHERAIVVVVVVVMTTSADTAVHDVIGAYVRPCTAITATDLRASDSPCTSVR